MLFKYGQVLTEHIGLDDLMTPHLASSFDKNLLNILNIAKKMILEIRTLYFWFTKISWSDLNSDQQYG